MKQYSTKEDGNWVLVLDGQWKIVFLPREEMPRHRDGSDYGGDQIVIARWLTDDTEHFNYLLWHRSCKYWRDRTSGYVPAPAELRLHRYGVDLDSGREIVEGGRLSQDIILMRAGQLAELTGIPAEVWRWMVISGNLHRYTAVISKVEKQSEKTVA
ncbi:MAG: hypothetical protein MOB07_31070 [Acidobacteria bacterium]|nr:hypothetical protein [Acidobacteriota bacterium]